jgi:putative ABC transport system substrate-binding protein
MKRRRFVTLIGVAAAAWALPVCAQQSTMPVVGWLSPQPLNASQHFIDSFRKGLGEAGFVEGKGVTIELRPGGGGRHCRSGRTISSG